jgi:hypothetical protein
VTQILSDSRFDGDIEQTSQSSFTITQGMSSTVQSVFAGIDPVGGTEFRAFLDFPLSGTGGVPGNASIDSAFLEIYIDDLEPNTGKLPIRVDLVAFQPPTLIETDFDRTQQPALASVIVSPDISNSDVGTFVPIDVTPPDGGGATPGTRRLPSSHHGRFRSCHPGIDGHRRFNWCESRVPCAASDSHVLLTGTSNDETHHEDADPAHDPDCFCAARGMGRSSNTRIHARSQLIDRLRCVAGFCDDTQVCDGWLSLITDATGVGARGVVSSRIGGWHA